MPPTCAPSCFRGERKKDDDIPARPAVAWAPSGEPERYPGSSRYQAGAPEEGRGADGGLDSRGSVRRRSNFNRSSTLSMSVGQSRSRRFTRSASKAAHSAKAVSGRLSAFSEDLVGEEPTSFWDCSHDGAGLATWFSRSAWVGDGTGGALSVNVVTAVYILFALLCGLVFPACPPLLMFYRRNIILIFHSCLTRPCKQKALGPIFVFWTALLALVPLAITLGTPRFSSPPACSEASPRAPRQPSPPPRLSQES